MKRSQNSIKNKILSSTILIISLSVSLCGIFSYYYFSDILKNQAIRDNEAQMAQVGTQIDYIQQDVIKFSHYVITDESMQHLIKTSMSQTGFDHYVNIEKIMQKLKAYVDLKNYVQSSFIIMNDGKAYSDYTPFDDYYSQETASDWYKNFVKRNVHSGFTEKHVFVGRPGSGSTEIISYVVNIVDLDGSSKVIGKLVVNIISSYFNDSIRESENYFDGFQLVNADGQVLFTNGYKDFPKVSSLHSCDGSVKLTENSEIITVINPLMKDHWKLISVTSKKQLFHKLNYIFYLIVFFVVISIFMAVALIMPVVINIIRPLSSLTDAMKQVSTGNLDVHLSISSGDEMEVLGSGFNQMTEELRKYIKESLDHEKTRRKLKINLLISQINPHFIYNTLNSVIYLAKVQKNDDIIKMVESFICILQDDIKLGEYEDFATVRQEKEIVSHYITIQKFRYPDRFDLIWNIQEDLYDSLIPKSIIQPLVENALLHGICAKEEKGLIVVSIFQRKDHLTIEVKDDGIGMDERKIKQILHGEYRGSESGIRNIGLSNIRERLEFIFGQQIHLQIESRPEEGTQISVVIPYKTN